MWRRIVFWYRNKKTIPGELRANSTTHTKIMQYRELEERNFPTSTRDPFDATITRQTITREKKQERSSKAIWVESAWQMMKERRDRDCEKRRSNTLNQERTWWGEMRMYARERERERNKNTETNDIHFQDKSEWKNNHNFREKTRRRSSNKTMNNGCYGAYLAFGDDEVSAAAR